MRGPRSVTMHPIGCPSRSLKFAIDFLALRIEGFCPVIVAISATAASSILMFTSASPTPMFTTIFLSRGACMGFV